MTAAHVPQAGQPVDKPIAIGIDQVRPLGLDLDPGMCVAGIVVQGMNHVLLIFVDQGAVAKGGIHGIDSLDGRTSKLIADSEPL